MNKDFKTILTKGEATDLTSLCNRYVRKFNSFLKYHCNISLEDYRQRRAKIPKLSDGKPMSGMAYQSLKYESDILQYKHLTGAIEVNTLKGQIKSMAKKIVKTQVSRMLHHHKSWLVNDAGFKLEYDEFSSEKEILTSGAFEHCLNRWKPDNNIGVERHFWTFSEYYLKEERERRTKERIRRTAATPYDTTTDLVISERRRKRRIGPEPIITYKHKDPLLDTYGPNVKREGMMDTWQILGKQLIQMGLDPSGCTAQYLFGDKQLLTFTGGKEVVSEARQEKALKGVKAVIDGTTPQPRREDEYWELDWSEKDRPISQSVFVKRFDQFMSMIRENVPKIFLKKLKKSKVTKKATKKEQVDERQKMEDIMREYEEEREQYNLNEDDRTW